MRAITRYNLPNPLALDHLILTRPPAQLLSRCPLRFLGQSTFFRSQCRLAWPPAFRRDLRPRDKLIKPRPGLGPVRFLRAMLPRRDNQNLVLRYSISRQHQEPLANLSRQ